MRESNRSGPVALVTDSGRGSAIAIIRSLGRAGWHVIAADAERGSLGFRSRYAAGRFVYPAPENHPLAFVDAISEAVSAFHVDLVIPVTDAAILPLSEARGRFDGRCKLAIPEPHALEVVTDKLKTVALAEELGVPTPMTRLVSTVEEARGLADALAWPVVLKPQTSRVYRDHASVEAYTVSYAQDADELIERISQLEGRCAVLLQEYYAGIGHGVELLMNAGVPLAAFQHKRLREVPVSGGASAFRESVPLDPVLYDYALRLMSKLKWTGLVMVEFKVGSGGARLMEINGRVWGSLPLAVHCGMDFPAAMAALYQHETPPASDAPNTDYVVGRRSRNLELDVVWIATVLRGKRRYPFLAYPERSEAFMALLGLLNPTYRFDILSVRDPMPGLAELPRIIRKLQRKFQEAA